MGILITKIYYFDFLLVTQWPKYFEMKDALTKFMYIAHLVQTSA